MPTDPKTTTFLVRFEAVGRGRLNWEARIPRPVTNEAIVREVKRKKALASREIGAESSSDYGGEIYAGGRHAGRYLIVPGSEK